MILGITALGEGRKTLASRLLLWVAHMSGGALGGMVSVGLVMLLASPFRLVLEGESMSLLVTLLLLVLALIDLGGMRVRSRRRQVPATWTATYGWPSAFVRYGVLLGSGIATYVPVALTYAVLAIAALLVSPEMALVSGMIFGVARTGMAIVGGFPSWGVARVLYVGGATRQWVKTLSATVIATGALAVSFSQYS